MTKEEEDEYEDVEVLKKEIEKLRGRKFRLDCGHHVTFGHFLGNDVTIRNGKEFELYCLLCCY